jgi:hypothetical protein
MALNIQDARILIKRSTTAGQVPTAAPSNDHTDGTWDALDIYEGEVFINLADSKAWFRSNTGIIELATLNGPTDAFINGGNTFGATAVFGATDDQAIDFKANNTTIFSYDKNGIEVKTAKPIYFQDSGGSNRVDISAPSSISASYSLNLPTAQGSADTYLKNDGSGNLSWASVTGGGGLKSGTATASTTDVYTTTITGVSSYTTNDAYIIKFNTANSNGATLNINSIGAVDLVKNTNVTITGGDISVGQEFLVVYDGTNFQMIGIAPNQMFAYVTNADSVTINKGQPVYAFGASGDRMSVKLANNTSEATSSKTVGLVFSSSIAAGATGFVITQGVLSNVNTAAYTAGDTLYVGSTAGALTNTMPYAPNHLVRIGIVERTNSGNGLIYVMVQNGFQLDELSDVDITSTLPVNNDVLTYVTGTNNLWKPRSISTILGYTPASTASTRKILLKTTTDASTSSTTYVILYSGLIPANTFSVGDMFLFEMTYRKTGTTNTAGLRAYFNTSASLTGATQIAQKVTNAANNLYGRVSRTPLIKSATNTEVIIPTNNIVTDMTEVTNAASSLNINWTVDQYFIIAGIVLSASDTHILSGAYLEKI